VTPKATASVRDAAGSLTLRDAAGREQQLFFVSEGNPDLLKKFEMPPRAPENAFDVRFASGRILEGAELGQKASFPVEMTNPVYPVTLSWKLSDDIRDWTLITDGAPRALHGEGSILLSRAAGIALEAGTGSSNSLPREFALEQNFPNPFNPSTVIRYDLPVRQDEILSYKVSLRVYNMLGQLVATLVDEEQSAGYKSVTFDAGNLGSGMYMYKITAGSFSQSRKMVVVR
jgi:hypothetical protein